MSAREPERIADQLERAYRKNAWHGPSILELLSGVDETAAARRPIEGAHTIRELVLHIVAWQDEAVRRLDGEGSDLPPDKDWPADAAWKDVLARLEASSRALVERVRALDPSELDDPPPASSDGPRHPRYELLHGVVQHNLYHAGQIALLKKARG